MKPMYIWKELMKRLTNLVKSINLEWFVLREIRNDITHDYEDNQDQARNILNNIHQYRGELRRILVEIEQKNKRAPAEESPAEKEVK